MGTICIKSKNNVTSDPHRLLLNIKDEINLKRSEKHVSSSNHLLYMEKYKKVIHK